MLVLGEVRLVSVMIEFMVQDEKYGLVTTQAEVARHSPVLSNFVDVDLPEVSGKKCMAIRRSKLLLGRVAGDESDIRVSRTDLHGNDYHVIAADLTDTASLEAKLTTDCGLVSRDLLEHQIKLSGLRTHYGIVTKQSNVTA